MAKNETEVGITRQPVPKPRTAIQQHKLEKNRRKSKHLGKNVGGFSYSSDVNPYLNPRSVREEILVDYLLEEGFASDEKSAQAIAGAMSEEWVQSIMEDSKLPTQPIDKTVRPAQPRLGSDTGPGSQARRPVERQQLRPLTASERESYKTIR